VLQLKNATPFAALVMPLPDADGVDTLFTVVKATFTIGEQLTPADEQVPVTLASEHHGDPAASSLRAASDVSLTKPGTDVLLVGSAWAPNGRPTWQMDVSLRVGALAKTVRVCGDRVWDSGSGGATVAWVEPFVRMPLVWERAFGGTDHTDKGPVADRRNPVGAGFRVDGGAKPLAGLPLPNVEDPLAPLTSWKDRPTPAGFAPIAPHWEPRVSYAGTYDDAWQANRAPFLPRDFNPRFFHVAPPGLTAPTYLVGGEPVDVRGATQSGALRFALPAVRMRATYHVDSATEVRWANLDTVTIEPDEQRVVLVWRASLTCDKKLLRVRKIVAEAIDWRHGA
jgi:hypothetical protein